MMRRRENIFSPNNEIFLTNGEKKIGINHEIMELINEVK